MGSDAIYYEIGGGLFLSVLFMGIAYLRLSRVRKWESLLGQPAAEISEIRDRKKKRPGWVKLLPTDLDLSHGTLFEALYEKSGKRPEIPIPASLNSAMTGTRDSGKPNLPEIHAPMSDEERIKNLMSTPTDAAIGLPSEAIVQNLVLNLVNVVKGKQKLKQGIEHAVWDSLAPGGGFAGAKLGGAVGLAIAPFLVGVAGVFMPVSVIAGAWLGAWTGKKVGARFKARRYLAVFKRLRKVSREFQKWFIDRFPAFLEELDQDYKNATKDVREKLRDSQNRVTRLFFPNLMTVFYRKEVERLRWDHNEDRKQMKHLLALVRAQDPIEFASVLPHLGNRLLKTYPEFESHQTEYLGAMKELEELRAADAAAIRNPGLPRSEDPPHASTDKDPQSQKPERQRRSS